jgi:hypothetical protein
MGDRMPTSDTSDYSTEVTAMQNFYTNGELARIRIQERLDEATTARQLALVTRHGRFGRLGSALRNAFATEPRSDFDFVPQLVDYPAHAA